MKYFLNSLVFTAMVAWLAYGATGAFAQPSLDGSELFRTNGPVVFRLTPEPLTNYVPKKFAIHEPPPANLPPEIRSALTAFMPQFDPVLTYFTNQTFAQYTPGSLNYAVWTNFIALTNARNTVIWSVRRHPADWPLSPPVVEWNPAGLMWGMRGLTALSPCWESEGAPGVIPITALTRRHGYARGHGIGPDGFGTLFAGKRVWFLTKDNKLVMVKVLREVVRTAPIAGREYTSLLFDRDLRHGIQPMRVTRMQGNFFFVLGGPVPFFQTEQTGHVGANVPGFSLDVWKGGDSGSPNMLPLPGELGFCGGRSTSGPSPQMQADMDELCRLQGLNPKRYQLEWVDLSAFPTYTGL